MSRADTRTRSTSEFVCEECGKRFATGDELADHLTDVHDAFSWVLSGRPMSDE